MFTGINPSYTVLVYRETITYVLFFVISSIIENPHYCLRLIKSITVFFFNLHLQNSKVVARRKGVLELVLFEA